MFETIFTTLSGEKEIYTWNRVDDAVYHMNLFTEDDADLYQSICVVDVADDKIIAKKIFC